MAQMRLEIDAPRIKKIVAALSSFVKEAIIEVSPEGLHMRALDPSHVSLVDLDIPSVAFKACIVNGSLKIPISLEDLNKYLARARSEDTVTLLYKEKDTRVQCVFSGGGISTKRFQVPLSRSEMEDAPNPPEMEFDAKVVTAPEFFTELVKDAKTVAPNVTLSVRDGMFEASASETGGAKMSLEYSTEGLRSLELKTQEEVSAMYSLQYFEDFAKISFACDGVTLEFNHERPIRITFSLTRMERPEGSEESDEENKGGTVVFMLAPRIEHDLI